MRKRTASPIVTALLLLLRVCVLHEQIVGCTLQNVAKCLQILKFDPVCLIVDHLVEILIAESQLNVQPVFGLSLLFQYLQYA